MSSETIWWKCMAREYNKRSRNSILHDCFDPHFGKMLLFSKLICTPATSMPTLWFQSWPPEIRSIVDGPCSLAPATTMQILASSVAIEPCQHRKLYGGLRPLLPTWISDHIYQKVWDEITYPFLNIRGLTVEVLEWINNSSRILWRVWLHIHADIKVNPYH